MRMSSHALSLSSTLSGIALLLSLLVSSHAAAQTVQPHPSTTRPAASPDDEKPGPEPMYYVLMKTSMGDIALELNREKAPITVDNFLSYVDDDFYTGTIFHRVISTFMIQGGGFTADMVQKPVNAPIKLESTNGLKNVRGSIAMARTGVPDSATSQFFINVVDNPPLDGRTPQDGYAVFGKVIHGMDVVDQIRGVAVGNKGRHQNVPLEAVVIEKVTRLTPEEAKPYLEDDKEDDGHGHGHGHSHDHDHDHDH